MAAAAEIYSRAALGGSATAANNLGKILFDGCGGVTKDMAGALQLFGRGAAGGSASAMFNLAACFADGIGVKADEDIAAQWYAKVSQSSGWAAHLQCSI